MNSDEILAKRISYLQENSELSQTEIARRIGIDRSAFSRIKNNTRKVSADELSKIADIFGVTTDYLLGRKVDLGDVPVAAHIDGDLADLTEEERQEIRDYIEFKKAQYKKRHEKD
ncbi:helix-turn-helix transcriptional regulator [Levilactobacillus brevis]|uniref:helix-turn-helix domain-containing protein n=1 Tax=Levilactobacillus brevis TaxID=1580 RepID=UPI0030D21423